MRRALALRMGWPQKLLSRLMTYAEFLDWCREFARRPFDDEAQIDLPAAKLQAAVYNAGYKPGAAKMLTPADFLPCAPQAAEQDIDIDHLVMTKL